MSFKLVAIHKPTGTVQEYGPWQADENPMVAAARVSFAQGFVCGWNCHQYGPESNPEDLSFEVVEVPDGGGADTVGEIQTWATASVVHADGSTD
jgi:hypothetical protein